MSELKTLNTIDTSPFKRLVLNLGATPTAFTEGMTYYEVLAWLCDYIEKQVVPTTNEAIEQFNVLKDYVEHYFDNLDVQEEINNKLDQMAEDGTLTDIIAAYLNTNAVLGFNSVADLKSATNLIDGCYVRTYGYYSQNDGGGAYYKVRTVTNQDTEDDMFIIALSDNTLVAELVIENAIINVNQVGLKNDGTTNNSTLFKSLITKLLSNGKANTIKFLAGEYNFTTAIDFASDDIDVTSLNLIGASLNHLNSRGTTIKYTGAENTYFLTFKNLNHVNFENLRFKGNQNNACIAIQTGARHSYFNDVVFSQFTNHVWIKNYCGYVYFTHCRFEDDASGVKGVILNQKRSGESMSQDKNTEYVYFNECNFEGGVYNNSKHIVIYQGQFIYVDKCDLCNTSDTAIEIDGSGWAATLNDINITNCSFYRNHKCVTLTNGTGETRGLNVDGNFIKKDDDSTATILELTGTESHQVYNNTLSGTCNNYTGSTIVCNNVARLYINMVGSYGSISQSNSWGINIYSTHQGTQPLISYIEPTAVEYNGTSIDFIFGNLEQTETCNIAFQGKLNGVECYVAGLWNYGSTYSSKVTASGANLSTSTVAGRKLTLTCTSGNNPTGIGTVKFMKIK